MMLPAICVLVALGDLHGNPSVQNRVIDSVLAEPSRPDAVLLAGDYASLDEERPPFVQRLIRLRDGVDLVIATRGNHDNREWFVSVFDDLPQAHDVCDDVTVLSVESMRSGQVGWVQRQIEEHPERRYIVLMHYPPLTCSIESSQNDGGTRWRKNLETVLRPGDLIIAGHNHVTCEYPLYDGVFVYVTSRSGSKRYTCLSDPPGGDSSCDDRRDPAYLRLELEDGVWRRTWVEVP